MAEDTEKGSRLTYEEEPPVKMKLSDAHKYLGISFSKMTKLIKSGKIPYETNELDCRVKLVRRSDLDELRQHSRY